MIIYLVLFFLFSFCFHFYSSISFTFTLQIPFNFVLHLLFYLVFVLLYLLSFYIIIYPAYSLGPEMWGKDQQLHSFFPLDIHENIFFVVVLGYYIFMGTCFKFY